MRAMKYRLALAAFVCVLIAVPSATYARVHVSVGFGTTIGCGPYYGWYDPWCGPWYWHPYGPAWVYDYDPVFIGPPVVVERHVVHEPPLPRPRPAPPKAPTLSLDEQQKRSELTERLRIGDVDSRIKATQDLVGFADDAKTREALEKALRSDRDATVRKTAVEALARQSGKKAVPALKKAYEEDGNRDVRQAAYKALIMIDGY